MRLRNIWEKRIAFDKIQLFAYKEQLTIHGSLAFQLNFIIYTYIVFDIYCKC